MSPDRVELTDPRVGAAVEELKQVITARYPDATFDVYQGEDPEVPRPTLLYVPL